jgi:hypothetical protein
MLHSVTAVEETEGTDAEVLKVPAAELIAKTEAAMRTVQRKTPTR